jgi:hypothetical protein
VLWPQVNVDFADVWEMFVDAAAGAEGIRTECNSHKNQYSASLPAVTPAELAAISPVAFSRVVFQQRGRLRDSLFAAQIDHLDQLYGKLHVRVRSDNRLKAILSSLSSSIPFREAGAVLGIEFHALHDFYGGLSTVSA